MELEQPETESIEVEQPAEVQADNLEVDDLGTEGVETPETEEEEVEYEGEKFKLPPKLKDALLRQADYTRKTQEVASQREEVKAQREQVEQLAKFQQENAREIGQLVAIDGRLAQLQNLNWAALNQENPQQAQALHIELTQLQTARGQLQGNLTQKQQQAQWIEQQQSAKQLHEAEAFIKREIRDWSPEKNLALEAYAKAEGIDTKALGKLVLQSPAVMKLVDKAAKYDQLLKKQTAKPKTAVQEAPVTRIAAKKAGVVVDPDKLNPADWLKWRNSQLRKK